MRWWLGGLALLAVMSMAGPANSQQYPWCAQYSGPMGQNCGFNTYEQCLATVRGAGGMCSPNPSYVAPANEPAKPAKKKAKTSG